ncbi:MAG: DUF2281 domain-containing protein [Deltaproteobacteria bacterium]|nr:DUF2281 domain-containing protein [Deltaproteobacteria bacterium]
MTTWEMIAERAKELPPEKQQEVLDFVEFVRARARGKKPLRSPEGLCADLGIDITEEDIAQARREMWGDFPREDI